MQFLNTSSSSSSSCRAASRDLSESLLPPASIILHSRWWWWLWGAFKAISCIGTELLYIGSSWSSCFCTSMWRGPLEYIAYRFVLTSLAVSRMSGSSNLDSFREGWLVDVLLLFRGLLPPGPVQYCLHFSWVTAINFFSISFVSVRVVHPCSSMDTTAAWKKLHFILSVRSGFYMTDSSTIAVHAFASGVLISVSVDETLLPG